MFRFFKKGEEAKNIREYLERKSREIEFGGWISTSIFTADGLKVFSKQKPEYNTEKVYPYAIKLFQTALKFHEKANPGLKVGGFEPPRLLVYQMETRETVFIIKGYSKERELYLIYITDPELSVSFSMDRTAKRLQHWLFDVSKGIDKILRAKR